MRPEKRGLKKPEGEYVEKVPRFKERPPVPLLCPPGAGMDGFLAARTIEVRPQYIDN